MRTDDRITYERKCYSALSILRYVTMISRPQLRKILDVDDRGLSKICKFLLGQGLAIFERGSFTITEDGREAYQGARRRVFFDLGRDTRRFKDEVLLGIREEKSPRGYRVSEQSPLENAALPTVHYRGGKNDETVVDLLLDASRKIRTNFGISEKRWQELVAEGRVQICRGIGNEKHIGIFDRKNAVRWESLCRECRRKQREGRKDKKHD